MAAVSSFDNVCFSDCEEVLRWLYALELQSVGKLPVSCGGLERSYVCY